MQKNKTLNWYLQTVLVIFLGLLILPEASAETIGGLAKGYIAEGEQVKDLVIWAGRFFGIILVIKGLWDLYKMSDMQQQQQQSAAKPWIEIVVGGCLGAVSFFAETSCLTLTGGSSCGF